MCLYTVGYGEGLFAEKNLQGLASLRDISSIRKEATYNRKEATYDRKEATYDHKEALYG